MVAIPEAVDSDFWRADATRADSADVALRFPVLADVLLQQRFVLLSVFKWEHRKGWCASVHVRSCALLACVACWPLAVAVARLPLSACDFLLACRGKAAGESEAAACSAPLHAALHAVEACRCTARCRADSV